MSTTADDPVAWQPTTCLTWVVLGVRFQRERAAPFAQSVEALRQGKLDLMAVAVILRWPACR
jgi:hypothetical protein